MPCVADKAKYHFILPFYFYYLWYNINAKRKAMKVLSYSAIQNPAENGFYNGGIEYKIANYRKNLLLEEENAERQQAIMDKEYWQELATQAQAQELVDLYNALAGKEDFKQIVNLLKGSSKQITQSKDILDVRKNAGFELPKDTEFKKTSDPLPLQNVRGRFNPAEIATAKKNLKPSTTVSPADKPPVNTNPFGITQDMILSARDKLRKRKSKLEFNTPRTGGTPERIESPPSTAFNTPRTGATPTDTSPNSLSPKNPRQRGQQKRRMNEQFTRELMEQTRENLDMIAEDKPTNKTGGSGLKKKKSKATVKPRKARKSRNELM